MKPTKAEILKSLQRLHLLSTAINAEVLWVREHLKPDAIKILSHAKASCNHMKTRIERELSPEAKLIAEERGFELLEKLMKEI